MTSRPTNGGRAPLTPRVLPPGRTLIFNISTAVRRLPIAARLTMGWLRRLVVAALVAVSLPTAPSIAAPSIAAPSADRAAPPSRRPTETLPPAPRGSDELYSRATAFLSDITARLTTDNRQAAAMRDTARATDPAGRPRTLDREERGDRDQTAAAATAARSALAAASQKTLTQSFGLGRWARLTLDGTQTLDFSSMSSTASSTASSAAASSRGERITVIYKVAAGRSVRRSYFQKKFGDEFLYYHDDFGDARYQASQTTPVLTGRSGDDRPPKARLFPETGAGAALSSTAAPVLRPRFELRGRLVTAGDVSPWIREAPAATGENLMTSSRLYPELTCRDSLGLLTVVTRSAGGSGRPRQWSGVTTPVFSLGGGVARVRLYQQHDGLFLTRHASGMQFSGRALGLPADAAVELTGRERPSAKFSFGFLLSRGGRYQMSIERQVRHAHDRRDRPDISVVNAITRPI